MMPTHVYLTQRLSDCRYSIHMFFCPQQHLQSTTCTHTVRLNSNNKVITDIKLCSQCCPLVNNFGHILYQSHTASGIQHMNNLLYFALVIWFMLFTKK